MSEKPPETTPPAPEQPAPRIEAEPGSYERALELFKRLKEQGIRDPLAEDDPRVQEAQEALDAWERAEGLGVGGIESLDHAKQLVRSALIFLEAGFTGKNAKADAKQRLDELYGMAGNEGNAEAAAYIAGELEKFEPKSALEKLLDKKLAEAAEMKPVDAIGTLTGFLISSPAKRLTPAQRQRVEDLRTAKRAEVGAPPVGQSWKK